MSYRKSKLSTFSTLSWFWKNIFGINPKSRRTRVTSKRRKSLKLKENINSRINIQSQNNNNNRNLDSINVNQQRTLCILIKNPTLAKQESISKNSRIIDLQDLIQLIQSKHITHEDASTMTDIEQLFHEKPICRNYQTQSENIRRLKALKFIRIFIENNKEDFFKCLINEEHLCEQKILAIYQIIEQFLKIIYEQN